MSRYEIHAITYSTTTIEYECLECGRCLVASQDFESTHFDPLPDDCKHKEECEKNMRMELDKAMD